MISVHIITKGCSLNLGDSEIIEGILVKSGFKIVNVHDADVIIYNTCTVKGPTESSFRTSLMKFRKQGRPIIIAGCLTQAQKDLGEFKDCSIIGVDNISDISRVVSKTFEGERIHLLKSSDEDKLELPHVRKHSLIEIIPINAGCMSECSYCKTKAARGSLRSYPMKQIVNRVRTAVNTGAREIWLTSQDTGAYGLDIRTNIGKLLLKILEKPGDYKLRLGMSNPHYVYMFRKDIVKALKDSRMYRFLHLPVQSGNNRVLKLMKRPYTIETFKKTINYFRKEVPDIALSTDVICGFPTETDKEFEDTLRLIKDLKFDVVHISKFWLRSGTDAEKLEQLPGRTIKERSIKLTNLFSKVNLKNNKKWINWTGRVLINEKGFKDSWKGRTDCYRQVILKGDYELGESLIVKIKSVTNIDLRTFTNPESVPEGTLPRKKR